MIDRLPAFAGSGIKDVDGIYWTLLVELCFYGCMLGLFIIRALSRIEWVLTAWMLLTWVWHFAPNLSYTLGALLIKDYIPYFAIGIIAYRLYARESTYVSALPIVLLAAFTVYVQHGTPAFAMFIVLVLIFSALVAGRLSAFRWPLLIWLGGISYAIYLLHEYIGWVVIHALERRLGFDPHWAIALTMALVLSAATLVRVYIEIPAMKWIRSIYSG